MNFYIKKVVIKVLEKNLLMSGLMSVLLSFILAFQLQKHITLSIVFIWLLLLVIVNVVRCLYAKYRNQDATEQRTLTLFRCGCLLSGAVWGIGCFYFYPYADTVTRLYISFALGGLAAAASSSLAADKYSFLMFTLPLLLPNIAANFLVGEEVSTGMVIMLFLFLGFISFSSRTMGLTLIENLHLKKQAENSEKRAKKLAYYDQLTELPNRFLFEDRLKQILSKHRRYDKSFAVLFIDLDGFKKVNDDHGHHAGDEVLKHLANKFKQAVRTEDTIARIGGDEFVGILQDVDDNDAVNVARKLLKVASLPIKISCGMVQVTASIGVAMCPKHANTVSDLLTTSDNFMYSAKGQGKNKIVMGDEVYS